MNSRDFIYLFIFIINLFLGAQGWLGKKNQPHIIVIMSDDMGWNDVGFHGSNEIPTPNLDALAYNGVILNRYYTLPICSPSRASYLTGRYAIRMGMQGLPIVAAEPRGVPLNEVFLPQYLKELGYTTRMLGKWHLGHYTEMHTPTNRGFDSFTGYYTGYVKYFNHSATKDKRHGIDFHKDEGGKLAPFKHEQYLTDYISDQSEVIIRNHDKSKPLYLQLSHLAAHASEGLDNLEVRDVKQLNGTLGYIPDMKRRRYAGIVKALDDSIGRVMNALRVTGMLQNSVVIFMSDNGAPTPSTAFANYGSNYPLRGAKVSCFEGGVRVPALIFSPLIKKRSRVSQELMHITDWMPTLIKLAGGNLSEVNNLDGVDQWGMISNGEKSKRDSILLNIDEQLGYEAFIKGKFKFVKGNYSFNSFYSENGNYYSPEYKIEKVKSSLAAEAVKSLLYWSTRDQKIRQIRNKATVTCVRRNYDLNCPNGCLFDILTDPCETKDISDKNPRQFQSLKNTVDSYRYGLVNQTNTYSDPRAYPEYFGDFWKPWLTREFTPPINRNMSYILSEATFCEGFLVTDPRNCLY